jgi:CRP-like cAMP-binding protein
LGDQQKLVQKMNQMQKIVPADNHLLHSIESSFSLSARKEIVNLKSGACLFAAGRPAMYVYFPITCRVSLIAGDVDNNSMEVAAIGNEGVVGLSAVTDRSKTTEKAIVQYGGSACCVQADYLREAIAGSAHLSNIFLNYSHALARQIIEAAIDANCHTIEQRFCRWLLRHSPDESANNLFATHKSIADLLGVRRESVTLAACKLEHARIIEYRRGRISILNRELLKAEAEK